MIAKKILSVLILVVLFGCGGKYRDNKNFILPGGIYKITSYQDEYTLAIEVDEIDSVYSVIFDTANQLNNTRWKLQNIDGKEYKIQSLPSEYFLTENNNSDQPARTPVTLEVKSKGSRQIWFIHRFENDKFKIVNKSTLLSLCITDTISDDFEVYTRKSNNGFSEFWLLERIDEE